MECNIANWTSPSFNSTKVTTSSVTYSDTALEPDHCHGPFGTSPQIVLSGCGFTFNINGTVELQCPAGAEIVLNASGCTIRIKGGQSFAAGATYTNIGGPPMHVTVSVNIREQIQYSHEGILCGNGTGKGSYAGANTVKGFNGAAQTDFTA